MHYIRCIWGWLLRGPSQGYHYFPYDSSIYLWQILFLISWSHKSFLERSPEQCPRLMMVYNAAQDPWDVCSKLASLVHLAVMSPWNHRWCLGVVLLGTGFQGSIASFGAISTNACRRQQFRLRFNVLWLVFFVTSNCGCFKALVPEWSRTLTVLYLILNLSFTIVCCWWTFRNH